MGFNFIFGDMSVGFRILIVYLAVINIVTFLVFGIDKHRAVKQKFRIRVRTLFGLALAGGSLGGLLAMYLFRHKTRKTLFTVGIPAILIVQAALLLFAANKIF